jgi:HNH endonuclease
LRAGNRCEYCHMPQMAFKRRFHLEHITARSRGGATNLDNLAFACWCCNVRKGAKQTGVDPESGETVELFHPRKDVWTEHFELDLTGWRQREKPLVVTIRGITAQGRATVSTLRMNDEGQQMVRTELWRENALGDEV